MKAGSGLSPQIHSVSNVHAVFLRWWRPWNFARVLFAPAEPVNEWFSFSFFFFTICLCLCIIGIFGSWGIPHIRQKKHTHTFTVRQGHIKHVCNLTLVLGGQFFEYLRETLYKHVLEHLEAARSEKKNGQKKKNLRTKTHDYYWPLSRPVIGRYTFSALAPVLLL